MNATSLQEVLKGLAAYEAIVFKDASGALIAVMALHIIAGALAWHFWGRSMWTSFSYPIVAAVLMTNYVAVYSALVQIPGSIGDQVFDAAWTQWWMETSRLGMVVFAEKVGILTTSVTDLLVMGLAELSVLMALVALEAMRVMSYVVLGILYVIGPMAIVAMAFRATASWGIRWVVACVEVGTWKLIYSVMLAVVASVMSKVQNASYDIDVTNPETWLVLAESMAVLFVAALGILATPIIARALIGGGVAFAMGAAASMPAKQAASAAGSAATGAVGGGAMGGPVGAAVGAASGAMSSAGVRGIDMHAVYRSNASSGAKAQQASGAGGDSGGSDGGGPSGGDSGGSDGGASSGDFGASGGDLGAPSGGDLGAPSGGNGAIIEGSFIEVDP